MLSTLIVITSFDLRRRWGQRHRLRRCAGGRSRARRSARVGDGARQGDRARGGHRARGRLCDRRCQRGGRAHRERVLQGDHPVRQGLGRENTVHRVLQRSADLLPLGQEYLHVTAARQLPGGESLGGEPDVLDAVEISQLERQGNVIGQLIQGQVAFHPLPVGGIQPGHLDQIPALHQAVVETPEDFLLALAAPNLIHARSIAQVAERLLPVHVHHAAADSGAGIPEILADGHVQPAEIIDQISEGVHRHHGILFRADAQVVIERGQQGCNAAKSIGDLQPLHGQAGDIDEEIGWDGNKGCFGGGGIVEDEQDGVGAPLEWRRAVHAKQHQGTDKIGFQHPRSRRGQRSGHNKCTWRRVALPHRQGACGHRCLGDGGGCRNGWNGSCCWAPDQRAAGTQKCNRQQQASRHPKFFPAHLKRIIACGIGEPFYHPGRQEPYE